jgi:hypothetical protein
MPSIFRPALSFLLCAALLAPSSFSYDLPLSDQAVREAYFLGQRNDSRTTDFFKKYTQYLPVPDEGPQVASIQFLTPFANVVDLSRQNSLGNSAQDALEQYKKHGDVVRVIITLQFTPSYGVVSEQPVNSRSGSPNGFKLRSSNFWRDFSYRLFQKKELIEPLDVQGEARYSRTDNGSSLTGAVITLLFDANKISSTDDADIVVDTVAGQQTVTTFDLASLR